MSTQGKFEPSYPTLISGIILFLLWLTQPTWRLAIAGFVLTVLAIAALKLLAPWLNTTANNAFKQIRKYPTAYGIAAFLATLAIVFAPAWSPWFAGVLRNGGKDVSTIDIINKFGLLFGGAMGFTIAGWRAWCQDRQTKVEEQGLITERIIKATEQLGSKEMAVRIGGIYSLWRTAMDSPLESDKRNILDILCAFIRMQKPDPAEIQPKAKRKNCRIFRGKAMTIPPSQAREQIDINSPPRVSEDVQTALTLIGRRQKDLDLQQSYTANLNGAYLVSANLTNLTLIPINLQNANLQFTQMQGVNMQGATLLGAQLQAAQLQEANLQGANLQFADMQWANLQEANLEQADLIDSILHWADLRGSILKNTNLQQAEMHYTQLAWAELQNANMQGAEMHGADLLAANLTSANLQDAEMEKAKMRGANLLMANLHGANLQYTDLQDTNLIMADLYKAKLQWANLQGANLQGATLVTADLSHTNIHEANYIGANFTGAILPKGFSPNDTSPPAPAE